MENHGVLDQAVAGGVNAKDARKFDQFFTQPHVAFALVSTLGKIVPLTSFDTVIEPSFGQGAFILALCVKGVTRLRFVDLDAKDERHRADFLTSFHLDPCYYHAARGEPRLKTCLTVGNPPFGKRSALAVAFFNHAATFSDVIAFIVPRTFRKASIINQLDRHFFLVHDETVQDHAFQFENVPYDVPCAFQVWMHSGYMRHSHSVRPRCPIFSETPDFVFVKASENPDVAIRRVGVNAGRLFTTNVGTQSVESHLFLRFSPDSEKSRILETLRALNLETVQCKFDTAGNPSISKSEVCQLYLNFSGN